MTVPVVHQTGRWTCPDAYQVMMSARPLGPDTLRGVVRRDGWFEVVVLPTAAEALRFPDPWPDDRFTAVAMAPDGGFVVTAGVSALRAIGSDGRPSWEYSYPRPLQRTHPGSLVVTADGSQVWTTVPAEATTGRWDRWLVLDAHTGTPLADEPIDAVGVGSEQLLHPDGVHVALSVGEGQNGAILRWGSLTNSRLHQLTWPDDRVLADISPTGRYVLTVAHDQSDATVHTFPDGATRHVFPADTPPRTGNEDPRWDYYGGFLDDTTLLLSDVEFADDQRDGHWLANATTGHLHSELTYPFPVAGYPKPLGDNTWLTATDNALHRWTLT